MWEVVEVINESDRWEDVEHIEIDKINGGCGDE